MGCCGCGAAADERVTQSEGWPTHTPEFSECPARMETALLPYAVLLEPGGSLRGRPLTAPVFDQLLARWSGRAKSSVLRHAHPSAGR